MTDTQEIVVKLNENEKSAKIIESEQEQNVIENGKEKNEMTEKGKEREEEKVEEMDGSEEKDDKETEVKKESTVDRFMSWWRGNPKADDEEEEKEKLQSEEKAQTKKEVEKEKEGGGEKVHVLEKSEEKEEIKEVEKKDNGTDNNKLIDAKVQSDFIEHAKSEVVPEGVKQEQQSSPIDHRRLEKIVEEQKHVGKSAPLAQAEEEDLESLDSRPSIDQTVPEPNTSETVEASKDSYELESPPAKDIEDKSEKRKSARVEVYVVLDTPKEKERPQTSDHERVNTPSEYDEVRKDSRGEESRVRLGEEKDSLQSGKMEEVIEERYDDGRRESVKESWKRLEETEGEAGKKTYRVSYTIRTTSIDKTKSDKNPADDDDEDRLFGDLLNSMDVPKTHEGPPPEDLEDEIHEDCAREDHAANEDIDRFFDLCKEDAPIAKDETEQTEQSQEEIIPQTPEDIFRKLHTWDDETTDWWTITKKKKDYEEWMKPMKDGTIRRVIIPAVEIPYETCVLFITDWKHREEWDKTFSEIQVLKSDKQSKVIYCPVKKRDLTFETMDQEETEPPCHVMTWKKQDVIPESEKADTLTRKKQKPLELITHTCGVILRPSESGDQATKITILCQLEGPVDHVLRNTFLAGHPKSWLRNLKKYYKKQQKQHNQKVVYL